MPVEIAAHECHLRRFQKVPLYYQMNPSSRLFSLATSLALICSNLAADSAPDDLVMTTFSGPDVAPCPACLCVGPGGDVFAGVDLNGSLGKGPGKGRIVKLIDSDKDGVSDSHTIFAKIDNPRGLISVDTKLYVLYTAFDDAGVSTGMNLAVLEDVDNDGVADGPEKILVSGICAADAINNRGTDHSTNGIQMGIDGWIYIAIGDFGFAGAKGTDGTELTLLGGGIVRVRPDGTEMELYTTGMRNIYDVAIDPYMNIFTRGNTNDGGGWNVRFNHHIQSGEYGYPRLFINFANEIIPALEDVGGGSGVGALFLSEPTWPEKYNNQPLMADWGRQAVYLHRLSKDGPSFTQVPETFVQISQVSDLDVDPSGQMFLSAWNGAGFKGNPEKGYIVRVVPEDWKYHKAPDFTTSSHNELLGMLATSASASTRLHAQQAILRSGNSEGLEAIVKATDSALANRVAALYTLNQLSDDPAAILGFADDNDLREFAIRASTDRTPRLKSADLSLEPFLAALGDGSPRQKAAATIALGRLGNQDAATALLSVAYRKPAEKEIRKFSVPSTLRGGKNATTKLDVQPGQKLYLSYLESNEKTKHPSQFIINSPTFVTKKKTRISLLDLQPLEGKVAINQNPGGAPFDKKQKKLKNVLTGFSGQVLVYEVPAGAIRFESKTAAHKKVGSTEYYASIIPPEEVAKAEKVPLRHARPNPEIIIPHLAVRSLVNLNAVEPCLTAIGTSSEDLALWALSYMHDPAAVDGLIEKLSETEDRTKRNNLLATLARLYQKEAPFKGDWWWSTRPDTRGPYYKPEPWSSSATIAAVLTTEIDQVDASGKNYLAELNDRNRMGIEKLGTNIVKEDMIEQPTVDLAKIASKQGAIGTTPIEDIILSLDKLKGDISKGEKLFTQQGCVACHALKQGGPALGPYMGQIGSIMNKEQIATAILRPNDTISQGFQTTMVTMQDGSIMMGFVTESNSDEMTLRDMAGKMTKIEAKKIKDEKHLPNSMMPAGLANALSLEDFASLVSYLYSKKQ